MESTAAISDSRAIIEPATWRDLNALRHLEQICFPQDAWPLWDLIGVLTFSNVFRIKATANGQMVGFIAADLHRSENLAWIATVGVIPEYRRQGIGSALLVAVEEQIGVSSIRLSVRVSNRPALNLYDRLGYHRYGTWPHYYADGEDALVLEKNLKGIGL
jgi:ribosomal protein S18 acetylase RimI-like enzyme